MRTTVLLCLASTACVDHSAPTGTVSWSISINGAPAGCDRLDGLAHVGAQVTAVLTSGETARTSTERTDCAAGSVEWDAATLQADLDFLGADAGDIDHLKLDASIDVASVDAFGRAQYDLHRSVPFADQIAVPFELTRLQLTWQPIPTDQLGGGWFYDRASTFIELSSHSVNSIVQGAPLPVHTDLQPNVLDYQQGSASLLVALGSAEEVSVAATLVAYDTDIGTSAKLDALIATALVAPATGATIALPLDGNP